MITTLWILIISAIIIVSAIRYNGVANAEWKPLFLGLSWVDLVWLVILIFSTINILLFITHGGQDAFALMNATVKGNVGARVGIGMFLLVLSASQVFKFFKDTTNVLAHGFLLLATTGMVAIPTVDTSATARALQAQLASLQSSIETQRPQALSTQRASVQHVSYQPATRAYEGKKTFGITTSNFFNPFLNRQLNGDEVKWCQKLATVGMSFHDAQACGFVK